MRRYILLLTLFLAVPAFAQQQPKPTLADLRKDLTIINLRIENIELRYRELKPQQKRLQDHIGKLEKAASKKAKTAKVDDKKLK